MGGQHGELKADDAKRLKELEKQNATLMRLRARRHGVRIRPAFTGAAGLAGRLCEEAPEVGLPADYHDARGVGRVVNHKKIQRLWRAEGLGVRQRRRRKRVGSSTADAPVAVEPNVVWAVDFQYDAAEQGKPIMICSIVDEHTRECIGGLVERSITADKLTSHLEDLVVKRGTPAVLRSDNGPEFISETMADWAGTRTGLSYIPPGSPWCNGYVQSFNARLRDECLNINSFYSLPHAQVVIGDWKTEYNHDRRH